jgi:dGTPase
MDWISLLSLRRFGDVEPRPRLLQDENRLGFEVDYDRIIFSGEFRSLQDKTQVLPLSKTDFVHTRLTHSLEVSVVGRTLGRIAGQRILERHPKLFQEGYKAHDFGAIVAAAALAHDIGNPPFGHGGERAIGDYFLQGNGKIFHDALTPAQWKDLSMFEGNANGFRLLVNATSHTPGGLRLSYATLGAFMKYPKPSWPEIPKGHIAGKKYGVFQSEISFFEDLAGNLGLIPLASGNGTAFARHPLAYLLEAADDICYSIIDFEDAINLDFIPEDKALEYLIHIVKHNIIKEKYLTLPTRKERVGYLRALSINTLIMEAISVFDKHEHEILKGSYKHSLLSQSKYKAQLEDILDITRHSFYKSREVIEREIKGYRVIQHLLDVFIHAANARIEQKSSGFDKLVWELLPEKHKRANSDNLYLRLMNITSFIAGMSDEYALLLYSKLI